MPPEMMGADVVQDNDQARRDGAGRGGPDGDGDEELGDQFGREDDIPEAEDGVEQEQEEDGG